MAVSLRCRSRKQKGFKHDMVYPPLRHLTLPLSMHEVNQTLPCAYPVRSLPKMITFAPACPSLALFVPPGSSESLSGAAA